MNSCRQIAEHKCAKMYDEKPDGIRHNKHRKPASNAGTMDKVKEKKQKKIAWRRMRVGWQMANPTGNKVIYVKAG